MRYELTFYDKEDNIVKQFNFTDIDDLDIFKRYIINSPCYKAEHEEELNQTEF